MSNGPPPRASRAPPSPAASPTERRCVIVASRSPPPRTRRAPSPSPGPPPRHRRRQPHPPRLRPRPRPPDRAAPHPLGRTARRWCYSSHDAVDQATWAGVSRYAPMPKLCGTPPSRPIVTDRPHLPSRATATLSPPGAPARAPTTPRRATSSARPPPRRSTQTQRPLRHGRHLRCAASTRSSVAPVASPSATTSPRFIAVSA